MKNIVITIICILTLSVTSCVQKSSEKTVVFTVDVSAIKDVKMVSLRGKEKPLNWRGGVEMTPIKPDSFYTATVTFLTGYKFTEVKFVVNDEFELKDKDNRRVAYSDSDTTAYHAVFDVQK
jgi:hypothetical protein